MKTCFSLVLPCLATLVVLFCGCSSVPVRPDGMPAKGLCGHRGDMKRCRENTPEAIRSAVARGAKMVEFDIQRCKTGELVVVHDLQIPVGDGEKEYVSQLPFGRLRKLGYATPEEMIAEVPREGVWINLHCYYADNRCIAEEMARFIKKDGRLHQAIFADFPARTDEAKAVVPGIHTCDMDRPGGWAPNWDAARRRQYIDHAIASKCDFIQFTVPVTAEEVKLCHDHGITVNYFKEDDPVRQQALFDMGVDFILTNELP